MSHESPASEARPKQQQIFEQALNEHCDEATLNAYLDWCTDNNMAPTEEAQRVLQLQLQDRLHRIHAMVRRLFAGRDSMPPPIVYDKEKDGYAGKSQEKHIRSGRLFLERILMVNPEFTEVRDLLETHTVRLLKSPRSKKQYVVASFEQSRGSPGPGDLVDFKYTAGTTTDDEWVEQKDYSNGELRHPCEEWGGEMEDKAELLRRLFIAQTEIANVLALEKQK